MPREAELTLNEREFVLEALQEGLRVDGRGLHDYRNIDLQVGEEYGQTEVRLGKTRSATRKSIVEHTADSDAYIALQHASPAPSLPPSPTANSKASSP